MKPITNWDNVRPQGESRSLPAGGYVCKIVGAKTEVSRAGNEMLAIALDITEGEYSGFFRDKYTGEKWPNAAIIRIVLPDENKDTQEQYNRKAGRVKRLINDVEMSNDPYVFKWDEKTLRGKTVGALFGREEFETQDGRRAWSTKAFYTCTADVIRDGNYTTPQDRPLPEQTYAPSPEEFVEISDMENNADLPF